MPVAVLDDSDERFQLGDSCRASGLESLAAVRLQVASLVHSGPRLPVNRTFGVSLPSVKWSPKMTIGLLRLRVRR